VSTEGSYPILGTVVLADKVDTPAPSARRARNTVLLLAASVAIVATGFGIVMPVFARRVGEVGSGVETLGLMTMSFALAAFLAAPLLGFLADRIGRRPLILGGLGAYVVVNLAFLFARSPEIFMAIRAVEGALTAGLMPASMGVVADIIPEHRRAQWVGVLMGSMGAGIVFGPVMGGLLYDSWGFKAPFIASAAMALIAFLSATVLVTETRTRIIRRREGLRQRRMAPTTQSAQSAQSKAGSLWSSLPRPLYVLVTLLFLDFVFTFGFTYIEPQMLFYFYEDLGWSTVRFGVVVGVFGLAMVFCQAVLGRASDKVGRMPVIVVGALLFSVLPISLAFVTSFPLLLVTALTAGVGVALLSPALGAAYLDITAEQHRSRIVGLKSSSGSLGWVFGPLILVGASTLTTPRGVFISAGVLIVIAGVLALVGLRGLRRTRIEDVDMGWQSSSSRGMAAQVTLRGIVVRARIARLSDTTW